MCAICGCNSHDEIPVAIENEADARQLHFGAGAAGLSVPGLSATRMIQLEADVLGANQRFADHNRAHFAAHGVSAYNLVSSPGSGKTTLLCATITGLRARSPELALAVIEGDQQTNLDAQRIRATGAPAVQVNTGRGCHLDARMVGEAFSRLDQHAHEHAHDHEHEHEHEYDHEYDHEHEYDHAHDHDHHAARAKALLLIENVGNLVCPALWDLGEAAKVVILSVTEGADKPIKYPDMFAAARLLLINKIDLLPYVDFDVDQCIAYARRVNPDIAVLQLSATRGDGMGPWLDWLLR